VRGWRLRAALVALAAGGGVAAAIVGAQQAPPRDVRALVVSGTAGIAGVVVHDDGKGTPVRNALVTIRRSGLEDIRTTSTDEAGRYTFSSLPAGTYTVVASKGAYILTEYGSPRPGLPGYPIAVSEGESYAARPIALVRGGVIAGRVTDLSGRPIIGASVEATQFFALNGERRNRAGAGSAARAPTNVHGEYRIFGLLPGEYLVLVPTTGATPPETTPQQLRWAEKPEGASPAPSRPIGYAPTLFPSAVSTATATPIRLAAGEERLGVDVQVRQIPIARVSGTVVATTGKPALATIWWSEASVFGREWTRATRASPDGRFGIWNLAPGTYRLLAQAVVPTGVGQGETIEWGRADVTVSGTDQDGLSIRLQPGLSMTGRVAANGTDVPDGLLRDVHVRLIPSDGQQASPVNGIPGTSADDGSFTVNGVVPGRYRLLVTPPPAVRDTWLPASAMLAGRDLLDVEIDIDPSTDRSGLVVTLSNRMPSLSGALIDAAGRPMSGLRVLLFSANPDHWVPSSRRVHNAAVDDRGAYSVSGLPAGEYLLVALTEVERQALYEPSYLEQFVPFAIKVAIADGEQKRQDLRVGGK
jgi:hypothetical protein